MSNVNLLPLLTGWDMTYGTGKQIYSFDTVVTYNGSVTIKSCPHTSEDENYARELNSQWIRVSPGDHVVFRALVKTDNFPNLNHSTGARIGIDFYGNSGILDTQPHGYKNSTSGWYSDGDAHWISGDINGWINYPYSFNDTPLSKFLLPWGNSSWKILEWDIIVPSRTYSVKLPDGIPIGKYELITGMIAWFDCRNVSDNANAWIANTELYINPIDNITVAKTFSGKVSQQHSIQTVSVVIDNIETLLTTTDVNGMYSISKAFTSGKYSVYAMVNNDSIYKAVSSNTIVFTV